jgi:hypothetical protein
MKTPLTLSLVASLTFSGMAVAQVPVAGVGEVARAAVVVEVVVAAVAEKSPARRKRGQPASGDSILG